MRLSLAAATVAIKVARTVVKSMFRFGLWVRCFLGVNVFERECKVGYQQSLGPCGHVPVKDISWMLSW